jgi:hypothetical protein
LTNDGAPHGDPLSLTAGELTREAIEQLGQIQYLGSLAALGLDRRWRCPPQGKAEAQIAAYIEVRVERIALKHHGHIALARLHLVDALSPDGNLAAADRLESGDHPQQGGLAAARGPHQDHELAVGDFQVNALHHRGLAEGLLDTADAHRCHADSWRAVMGRRHGAWAGASMAGA